MASKSHAQDLFYALCQGVNTPVSLGAWLRYKHGEHLDLACMELDPLWYNTSHAFAGDYAVVSYLSKYEGLDTGVNTQSEALHRFALSEERCKTTNEMFRYGRLRGFSPRAEALIYNVKRKIAAILGPFKLSNALKRCTWGPGATATLQRAKGAPDYKHCEVPSVTADLVPYLKLWLETDYHWFEAISQHEVGGQYTVIPACWKVIPGSRLVTVPKNAKTDRVIACEPTANSFFQQGVGRLLRSRLKRFGVDLDYQGRNQLLASVAYEEDLATLDLKAASDTIALEVVYDLLPIDWATYLSHLRSPETELPDGTKCRLEKFSSMGNAYTFELESLIFYAITTAVCEEIEDQPIVAVYGDDIICPQKCADAVIEWLQFFGFEVNKSKSFTNGPFYESCGKHYFKGVDVTPCYQKERILPEDEVTFIRAGNRLLRCASRIAGGPDFLDRRFKGAWLASRRLAPKICLRYQIPWRSEGDDGWCMPSRVDANFNASMGYHCKVLKTISHKRQVIDRGLYAHTLRGVSMATFGKIATSRSRLKPAKRWIIPQGSFEPIWI